MLRRCSLRPVSTDLRRAPRWQVAVVGGLEASLEGPLWKPDPVEVPLLVVLAEQPSWTPEYEAFVRELESQVDHRV